MHTSRAVNGRQRRLILKQPHLLSQASPRGASPQLKPLNAHSRDDQQTPLYITPVGY